MPPGYDFFASVAKRPAQNAMKKQWFMMPKYFKSIPKHGYAHKWMPVVDEEGQDVDVDPFNRIAKKGKYSEMLSSWQPWYEIKRLLTARGAPGSLQTAQDLTKNGITLSDYDTSILLWTAVQDVQESLKLRNPGYTRSHLANAIQLLSVATAQHTVGLESGSAIATLYGLGNKLDQLESLEVSLRHLIEDPEEHVKSKRDFYEALSIAPMLHSHRTPEEYDRKTKLCTQWQGKMINILHLRPTPKYWEKVMFHSLENNDHVRALEHFQNMDKVTEKNHHHYTYLMQSFAQRGMPDEVTALQLDMKHQRNTRYSSLRVWTLLLKAYNKKNDLLGITSTWEKLRNVMITRPSSGRKIKHPFRATRKGLAYVVRTFVNNGKAREGYQWWRREVLQYNSTVPSYIGFGEEVLLSLLQGMTQQGCADEVAELFVEIKNRSLHGPRLVGMQIRMDMLGSTTRGKWSKSGAIHITNGDIWKLCSQGLAQANPPLLAESHFALTRMFKTPGDTRRRPASDVSHLLEAAAGENELLLASSVRLLSERDMPLDGACYAAVMKHQIKTNDPGLLRTLSEMTAQQQVPPEHSIIALIEGSNPDCDKKFLKLLWTSVLAKNSVATRGVCSAMLDCLGLEESVGLKGFSEVMLRGTFGFEDFEPPAMEGHSDVTQFYIADGTVAMNLERVLEDGRAQVIIPQSVLSQLDAGCTNPAATPQEQSFFEASLQTLRKKASQYPDNVRILMLCDEASLNLPPRLPTPIRVVETARAFQATLLTNDVELAAYSVNKGQPVKVLHKHSKMALLEGGIDESKLLE